MEAMDRVGLRTWDGVIVRVLQRLGWASPGLRLEKGSSSKRRRSSSMGRVLVMMCVVDSTTRGGLVAPPVLRDRSQSTRGDSPDRLIIALCLS